MEDNTIKKAQKIMLEMLLEFDQICKKYQLTYWLDHGTLLGAKRGQCFIPWDDDLDISMPKEDYNKFLSLAPYELGSHRFLQNREQDNKYLNFFVKIRDRGSIMIDTWEEKKNIQYHQGIFIDIFPVNSIRKNIIIITCYKVLVMISKLFHNRYIKLLNITSIWVKIINVFHTDKGNYLVSAGETMCYVTHIDKDSVFPLGTIIFEGHKFPAPNHVDKYLSTIYGIDYLTPPPLNKRKTHSIYIDTDTPCKKELIDA